MKSVTLLDVNVLVALFEPDHVHHELAHDWFAEQQAGRMGDVPTDRDRFGARLGESARGTGLTISAIAARLRVPVRRPARVVGRDISLTDYACSGRPRCEATVR